ncbi:MAG: hypothetical protein HF967_04440 [Methanosarcinales archaeon]|nr:hypothetical protein [Methanosarcinales archaeon]
MSWKVVKLGDLIEPFSVKAKDYKGVNVSKLDFFGVSNTEGITMSKYAAEDKANEYKIMEKGCFAYNPYRVNVGSIAMLNNDIIGLISPAYVVFKVKENTIIPELLLKFLKSSEGIRQIKLHARGTVRQALRFSDLCQIKISLPDYDEQKEFYAKISNTEIESSILSTHLTHQLDLVKKLRQSFLREAMQGKLVEQNPNDEPATKLLAKIKAEKEQLIKDKKLKRGKASSQSVSLIDDVEIPTTWIWCRLGEMVNVKSGKRIHASDYRKEGIPFLRSGEIGTLGRGEEIRNQLFISKEKYFDIKDKFGVPKQGDILIACIGGSIGNTWVVDNRQFYYKDGNLVLIEAIPQIDTTFLLSYLKSPFFWKNTILNATDSSYNALTIVKLNDAEFPLPPLSEQKRIVAKLDELMAYCDSLEESIKNSQKQNEMLLGQVLREALEPKEITVKEEVL